MTTLGFPNFDDLFQDLLEDEPEIPFFNAIAPFGTSPSRRRFLQTQFNPVRNQFLGQLGRQIGQGQTPNLRFGGNRPGNFLQGFDFNRLIRDQPRFNRGASAQFFNPPTRFLAQR